MKTNKINVVLSLNKTTISNFTGGGSQYAIGTTAKTGMTIKKTTDNIFTSYRPQFDCEGGNEPNQSASDYGPPCCAVYP